MITEMCRRYRGMNKGVCFFEIAPHPGVILMKGHTKLLTLIVLNARTAGSNLFWAQAFVNVFHCVLWCSSQRTLHMLVLRFCGRD
jgi:hypothetical protein